MPIGGLLKFSPTSGLFDDVLEAGLEQECFSGRVMNDACEESWHLEIGQLQKTTQITPSVSTELIEASVNCRFEVGYDRVWGNRCSKLEDAPVPLIIVGMSFGQISSVGGV